MTSFNLTAYLDRIGLSDVPCTVSGLHDLQTAQLRSIPFESIDPFLGLTPSLDTTAIFDKSVFGGRGGYCFELNALLGGALETLGFNPRRSLARVRKGFPTGGPRSHLMMQVTLDGERWLADAGFGGPGALAPLRIDTEEVQQAPNGTYRIWNDAATGEKVLDRMTAKGWFPLYGFDDAFVGDNDIDGANYLCANWNAMPFPGNLMLAGFDGDTRIGVFNRAVTVETRDTDTRQQLEGFDDLRALVIDRLGIKVDPETLRRVWAKLQLGASG